MNFTKLILVSAGLCVLAGCGEKATESADMTTPTETSEATDNGATLDGILAGDHRTAEERARDEHRNPKETLMFFGIEPGMTVVEAWPGGGWYTQVLAPYLASGGGKLYAAGFSPVDASEPTLESIAKYESKYLGKPDLYGDIEMTVLGDGEIAPEGSADAVLTFRNIHNWQSREVAGQYFEEFYRALKPGGVLGVVEHRADGVDLPRDGDSGYAYTDDVKALAATAGFEFDQSSEINANPKDTKNHPFGVWTLPPSARTSEVRGQEDPEFDRTPYDAIGESDRMTLKFRKPETSDGALLE